jgi:hypothetical protein
VGPEITVDIGWPTKAAIAVCAAVTVLLGLFSSPMLTVSRTAAVSVIELPATANTAVETAQR